MKEKIDRSIRRSRKAIFLRGDFNEFGNYRNVSRILSLLQTDGVINRVGHGVYMKSDSLLSVSEAMKAVKSRLGKRVDRVITLNGIFIRLGKREAQIGAGKAQDNLDKFKLKIAKEIVAQFPLDIVREKSLSNLARWEASDVWCSAYGEWRRIFTYGKNEEIVAAMTGQNEKANRLRQSPPYAGLLDQKTVEHLRKSKKFK